MFVVSTKLLIWTMIVIHCCVPCSCHTSRPGNRFVSCSHLKPWPGYIVTIVRLLGSLLFTSLQTRKSICASCSWLTLAWDLWLFWCLLFLMLVDPEIDLCFLFLYHLIPETHFPPHSCDLKSEDLFVHFSLLWLTLCVWSRYNQRTVGKSLSSSEGYLLCLLFGCF